jgi:hypothetical protein
MLERLAVTHSNLCTLCSLAGMSHSVERPRGKKMRKDDIDF